MYEVSQVMQMVRPLLGRAGLPTDGWNAHRLSRRDDAVMHRVVVKLTAPGRAPLVTKLVFRPHDRDAFAKSADRQRAVTAAMGQGAHIHAVDPDVQMVLMDFVPGETLFDLCTGRKVADHARALKVAGHWVDRFHRHDRFEPRRFQPKFTLSHLHKLHGSVRDGTFRIPQRKAFQAFLQHTIESAPEPEDCTTIAAVGHGDLNMRNILIDGDQACGLDYGAPGLLPVGHDLARLFCHYGTLCAAPGARGDGPLPGIDLGPFFNGYTLTGPDDAVVAFLCKARLIRDWQTIPKAALKRSVAQQMRFRGIQKLTQAICS